MGAKNARECAYRALLDIEKNGAFSNIAVKEHLRGDMAETDKRLATSIVYGCVKYKRLLDYAVALYSDVKLKKLSVNVLTLLRMGIYQMLMLDRVPDSAAVNESVKIASKEAYRSKALINAILRKVSTQKESLSEKIKNAPAAVRYSYPDSIADLWTADYGKEFARKLMEAGNINPPVSVRINRLKISPDEFLEKMEKSNIKATLKCDYMAEMAGIGDVSAMEEYADGLFTPQGIGSYIAGEAAGVKKGDTVIDMCAAPGGKSTHLAEIMENEGRIYSFDIYAHKTELIDMNAKRLGTDIIKKALHRGEIHIKELKEAADAVIADVPCCGLGVIRKKPDIKWNFDIDSMDEICILQRAILKNAATYVKRGGVLVYSTCSISKRENEEAIEDFLKNNGEFELCPFSGNVNDFIKSEESMKGMVSLFPTDGMDGFFICKMRKKVQ